jgi:hypothetical protein
MKLRIIEIIDANGNKRYRIQRQWLWILWLTTSEPGDHATYIHEFATLEEAKDWMDAMLYRHRSGRVTQKNVICGGDVVGGDIYRIEKKPSASHQTAGGNSAD